MELGDSLRLCCPHCGAMLLTVEGPSVHQQFMFIPGLGNQPVTVAVPPTLPAINGRKSVQVVQDVQNGRAANHGLARPDVAPKFRDAALAWVKSQEPFVSEFTYRRMLHHLNPLRRFFGERTLAACADDGLIREYQSARMKKDGAGADCINKEVSVLKRTLERAGLWEAIAEQYQPLKVKASLIGRPLSEQLERRLFAAAQSKEEWRVAYLVALLLSNTVMSPSEVFFRRIRDIDLKNRWIEIPHGKTRFRVRRTPINNGNALKAVTGLLKLARAKGAIAPEHFLVPYRALVNGKYVYDPTRHAMSCRTAWRSLVRSIGEPRLRMKDFKHHDVTRLDEKGVARAVIHKLAGWSPSSRRLDDYSHVGTRMQPLRAAVKLLHRKRRA